MVQDRFQVAIDR